MQEKLRADRHDDHHPVDEHIGKNLMQWFLFTIFASAAGWHRR